MKVMLVAKPWRGGLAHYVLHALQKKFGDQVTWLPTLPSGPIANVSYHLSKQHWRQRLVDRINQGDHDLVLCINHLPEFAQLRYSDRHVIWLTDDPRPVAANLDGFGLALLSDPGYLTEFTKLVRPGLHSAILPFACDPGLHVPQPGRACRGGCFIANRDRKRDEHLQYLLARHKALTVYGNYFFHGELFWSRPTAFRPAVGFAQLGKVYARHSFSLNVHAAVVRNGTNMRTFECAAFDIPQLVEYRPGIEEYFTPGEEILTYNDMGELCECFDQLASDQELRRRLATRARERTLSQHTYDLRIGTIIKNLS